MLVTAPQPVCSPCQSGDSCLEVGERASLTGVLRETRPPFLKSAQCRFESDWGHGEVAGRCVNGANGSVVDSARRGVVTARGGIAGERSAP
jgi:hypothetical protein